MRESASERVWGTSCPSAHVSCVCVPLGAWGARVSPLFCRNLQSSLHRAPPRPQSLHTLGQAPAVSRSSPCPRWWCCRDSRWPGRWESQRVPSQPSASRFCHSPGTPFPLPGPTSSRMPTREQETAGSQGLRVGCGGQLSEFISASLISVSKAFRTVERDRKKCCINVR